MKAGTLIGTEETAGPGAPRASATLPPMKAGMLIAGEETPARSGLEFAVFSPSTGLEIGRVARGDAADVARAVGSARQGFERWSALAPSARERPLLAAAQRIEAEPERFLDLLIDESGSTISKARFEIAAAADLLRAAAGEARRLYGDTLPSERPGRLSLVLREPMGVVAAIAPFNAPLALLAKMVAFPLAAGNAVIAKPSEATPLVALAFARLLGECGLPPGVLDVVTGLGSEAGAALVSHPEVEAVTFTGSTRAGIDIAAAGARGLKRIHLELGGSNPLLVLEDQPVAPAARIAAAGAFFHAGQVCMASTRVIAVRPLGRALAEALAAEAAALHLGDLRDPRTAYGPLINASALAKVDRHVADARARGAGLLTGGRALDGLRYAPTVLLGVSPESLVWREETFGPVAAVVEASDLDHAIALANDSRYGLSAGVLTRDLARGLAAARRIRAGAVHVGTHSYQTEALAPIGGLGHSGIGRSGGKYSVAHFTELKWVTFEG